MNGAKKTFPHRFPFILLDSFVYWMIQCMKMYLCTAPPTSLSIKPKNFHLHWTVEVFRNPKSPRSQPSHIISLHQLWIPLSSSWSVHPSDWKKIHGVKGERNPNFLSFPCVVIDSPKVITSAVYSQPHWLGQMVCSSPLQPVSLF